MTNEIWKDVEGYEGIYQVSNFGRIKSIGRKNCSNVCLKDKILNPTLEYKNGYKRVCLCVNKTENKKRVHILVAKAFIPNHNNYPIVNHKNGIKTDNRVENLEWCTYKQNAQHAIQTGLVDNEKRKKQMRKIGKVHYDYKKNGRRINQYDLDGNFIKTWSTIKEASLQTNIIITSIGNCLSCRSKSAGGFKWKYAEK